MLRQNPAQESFESFFPDPCEYVVQNFIKLIFRVLSEIFIVFDQILINYCLNILPMVFLEISPGFWENPTQGSAKNILRIPLESKQDHILECEKEILLRFLQI